ncbi:unnamed protein product [Pseudo-nitzschia multistriata]|uniref:DUF6824 domain-containing protein n=1 Tax=Pseudo-nitzschia multistriata TaxID=183589 RepID=A0A448ZBF2_9STRA|nr:unnamed protein product [Pseudo-nitzschia multistriata]
MNKVNRDAQKRGRHEDNIQGENKSYLSKCKGRDSGSSDGTQSCSTGDGFFVSGVTQRLNEMSGRERDNALYDLHGIPMDDEYYDQDLNVHGNKIERDPKKLQELLIEFDQLLEEKLKNSVDNQNQEEFGKGIKLARQQDPDYVRSQQIKFLRADRYDAKLSSARMIRFFDMKLQLFCAPGYNKGDKSCCDSNDHRDSSSLSCLGRDLRLSDFSPEDLDLWKKTGFFQMCGMRDRAKRAIVIFFGKVITEAQISVELVLRAFLYICSFWSGDESIQKSGYVIVGYTTFLDFHLKGGGIPTTAANLATWSERHKSSAALVRKYLNKTGPLFLQMIRAGRSTPLRGVSRHFCYDHPKLQAQFEELTGYMPTFSAARFRCHYANMETKDKLGLLSNTNGTGGSCGSGTAGVAKCSDNGQSNLHSHAHEYSQEPTPYFNQHKELLFRLMTFGIPRDTMPINDITGEVNLKFHVATVEIIMEIERNMEQTTRRCIGVNKNKTVNKSNLKQNFPYPKAMVVSTNAHHLNYRDDESKRWEQKDKLRIRMTRNAEDVFPNSNWLEIPHDSDIHDDEFDPSLSGNNVGTVMFNSGSPGRQWRKGGNRKRDDDEYLDTLTTSDPSPNDVVMGRGPWNRKHPGNLLLKDMLQLNHKDYEGADRYNRMHIVNGMLDKLIEEHGTRFLYREQTNSCTENSANAPWRIARREKAHNKITHDFRNQRRQKQKNSANAPRWIARQEKAQNNII